MRGGKQQALDSTPPTDKPLDAKALEPKAQ